MYLHSLEWIHRHVNRTMECNAVRISERITAYLMGRAASRRRRVWSLSTWPSAVRQPITMPLVDRRHRAPDILHAKLLAHLNISQHDLHLDIGTKQAKRQYLVLIIQEVTASRPDDDVDGNGDALDNRL